MHYFCQNTTIYIIQFKANIKTYVLFHAIIFFFKFHSISIFNRFESEFGSFNKTILKNFMNPGNSKYYIWVLVLWYVCIYIYTNPSLQVRCDTRSIFKWSTAGLKSEFSFSETDCLTKAKETSLPYYLPIVEESKWIYAFLKGTKGNANSFIKDLNSGPLFHFLW